MVGEWAIRNQKTLCGGVFMLALLAGFLILNDSIINRDVAWHLHVAWRLLAGEMLYVDILEKNAPIIYYLAIIPLKIATVLAIPVPMAVALFQMILVALSWVLLWRVMRDTRRGLKYATMICAFFVLLFFPLISQPHEVGQKEHLMLVFCLPYLFLRLLPVSLPSFSWRFRALLGVLAAIGFLIKPPYLLLAITIEVWRLLKTKDVKRVFSDATNIALGSVVVGVVLAVLLFTPYVEVMQTYFSFYLAHGKRALSATIFAEHRGHFIVPIAFLGALFALPASVRLLVILTCVSGVVVIWQQKFWDYQFIPYEACLFILYVFLVQHLWHFRERLALLVERKGGINFFCLFVTFISFYVLITYQLRVLSFERAGILFAALCFCIAVFSIVLLPAVQSKTPGLWREKRIRNIAVLMVVLAPCILAASIYKKEILYKKAHYMPRYTSHFEATKLLLQGLPQDTKLMPFIVDLSQVYTVEPYVDVHISSSSYGHFWPIHVIKDAQRVKVQGLEKEKMAAFKTRFISRVLEDLKREQPTHLLFDVSRLEKETQGVVLEVLLSDVAFRHYFFEHYRFEKAYMIEGSTSDWHLYTCLPENQMALLNASYLSIK